MVWYGASRDAASKFGALGAASHIIPVHRKRLFSVTLVSMKRSSGAVDKIAQNEPKAPREPLNLAYFEQRPQSFSGRIFSHLARNPIFRPRLREDGSPTDDHLLTVAATVISASDAHIDNLEKRAHVLNSPMFQPALKGESSDTIDVSVEEAGWFSKYLTLRNFLSVTVVIIAGVWAFFTWFTADKNAQVTVYKGRLEDADRRNDLLEKAKAGIEVDISHWKREAEDFRKEAESKVADGKVQISKIEGLQKDLDSERSENRRLVDALKKAATPPPISPASK